MISKVYKTDDNRPKSLEDEFSLIGIDFDGAYTNALRAIMMEQSTMIQ